MFETGMPLTEVTLVYGGDVLKSRAADYNIITHVCSIYLSSVFSLNPFCKHFLQKKNLFFARLP